MATYNTVTTFAGFLKTKYASAIVNTIPEGFVAQRDWDFGRAQKIGEQYQQAVITQLEHGVTYAASGAGAFTLNAAVAGSIEKAQVNSTQVMLKSAIDHETLAKAASKGEMAYGSSGDQLLKSMAMSMRKRLEISLWMGGWSKGCGEVSAYGSNVYTITAATWAPSVWVGMEGAVIEVFDTTLATNRGSSDITAVDLTQRKITVTAGVAGSVATDVLVFKDMRDASAVVNDFYGLLYIAGITSGTLWNISTNKSAWAPEQVAIGGALTFAALQTAAVTQAAKGVDGSCTLYCALSQWAGLLTEQAALKRFGGREDGRVELVNGGRAIRFWTVCGEMMIKPTGYMPGGYAVLVPNDSLVRVGATDLTFTVPGMDQPLAQVSDTVAGVSLMAYYNQALFTPEPGKLVLLTGIT